MILQLPIHTLVVVLVAPSPPYFLYRDSVSINILNLLRNNMHVFFLDTLDTLNVDLKSFLGCFISALLHLLDS